MGGFLGIGGSSVKTDRSHQLAGYGDLQNVFNFALPTSQSLESSGAATTKEGLSTLGDANSFWKNILQGSRPQVMQAVAPAVNAAESQEDAARRQQVASGTSRTGGVNAGNQDAQFKTQGAIDTAIAALPGQAASEEGKIGAATASIGQGVVGEALNALGLGSNAAQNLTSDASGSRVTSNAINQQTQQQWGQLIGTLLLGA